MPLALMLAVAGSLALHAAALFDLDIAWWAGSQDERPPLQAELRLAPPPGPQKVDHREKKPALPAKVSEKPARHRPALDSPSTGREEDAAPPLPESAPVLPAEPVVPLPAKPRQPAAGTMRYRITRGIQGFEIGRAEHHWQFSADGHYQLLGINETSGLVGLFKPIHLEVESTGLLLAGGLQPARFRTRKRGVESNENADFDWENSQVHLARDGSVQAISPGTQDILSLAYQLAYLPHLEAGSTVGVVTGKKYDRFTLDSLGEESIDIPAGHFRTLHIRAVADGMTEIWIALDLYSLPVKIRVTEKKGDVYEQVASEIEAGKNAAQ